MVLLLLSRSCEEPFVALSGERCVRQMGPSRTRRLAPRARCFFALAAVIVTCERAVSCGHVWTGGSCGSVMITCDVARLRAGGGGTMQDTASDH